MQFIWSNLYEPLVHSYEFKHVELVTFIFNLVQNMINY